MNGRLYVGNSNRTWAIDQLYRESIAVQIALGAELNKARVTVTPVLCAIGGVASSEGQAAGRSLSGWCGCVCHRASEPGAGLEHASPGRPRF